MQESSQSENSVIVAASNELTKRAQRARIEGIVYLSLALVVAILIVIYFGSLAMSERSVNIDAPSAQIETIHINQQLGWADIVGEAILRVGSVLLAVFVIQILVTFARNRYGLSDLLYSRSLALRLAGGDPDKLAAFATHLSAEAIDFGKMPKHPYEDVIGIAKELAKKIPGPSSK